MQLIRRISVVCVALTAIGFAGCSVKGPAPVKSGGGTAGTTPQAEPAAPTDTTSALQSETAKDSQQPGEPTEPQPAQARGLPESSPAPETPNPKVETAQDLFAKIQELQENSVNPRAPRFVANQRTILELSEKVLASNPEPADRDQARQAWLQAVGGVTMAQGKEGSSYLESLDKLGDQIIREDPQSELAAQAHFFKIIGHLNVERDGSEKDPSINKRLFEWTKTFADQFPKDLKVGVALLSIGQNAMMDGQYDTAKDIHRLALDLQLGGGITQQAEQTVQKLEMVGKPFPVSGPTLSGSEINIDELKGKVVLVDFWATWCGPCLEELPNVQQVYEKYHDQGFEIRAVCLDRTKDALDKFVAQRKIPWAQIFFDEEGKRWWSNPVAEQYGIHGIPATFLVDREGNLARFEVRGPTLEPAVMELLKGAKPPEEK